MKVVCGVSQLECTLDEFLNNFFDDLPLTAASKEHVASNLRGGSKIKPRFRIPSADGKSDVFFNNREMLCRFASFTTPHQAEILSAIRKALTESKVQQMVIMIPWSKTNERKLLVRASGVGVEVLDFEIAR